MLGFKFNIARGTPLLFLLNRDLISKFLAIVFTNFYPFSRSGLLSEIKASVDNVDVLI